MVELYPWLKALHVIAVIAWMAGLLYLPRLFVYHAGAAPGSELAATLAVMERKLLRAIMTPALVLTWGFGIAMLAVDPGWLEFGWLHVKLAAVLGLTALHGLMARWRREFAAGANRRPARFYRMINEVPTLLMILIVIMVVIKPW